MNNQDYKSKSFEDYKAQFQGLCTDSMAFDMWVCFETTRLPDGKAGLGGWSGPASAVPGLLSEAMATPAG